MRRRRRGIDWMNRIEITDGICSLLSACQCTRPLVRLKGIICKHLHWGVRGGGADVVDIFQVFTAPFSIIRAEPRTVYFSILSFCTFPNIYFFRGTITILLMLLRWGGLGGEGGWGICWRIWFGDLVSEVSPLENTGFAFSASWYAGWNLNQFILVGNHWLCESVKKNFVCGGKIASFSIWPWCPPLPSSLSSQPH